MAIGLIMASDGTMPQVIVHPAAKSERRLLEGLFQLYAYDWSEMEPPDSPALEVDAAGRFEPHPRLSDYWSAGEHWPLLIQTNERTVGFALINALSHQAG